MYQRKQEIIQDDSLTAMQTQLVNNTLPKKEKRSIIESLKRHYELNLTTPEQRQLLNRLKDESRAEPDSSNWTNIVHDQYTITTKVAGNYGPPEVWRGLIPDSGTFSFDYVSSLPPPSEAEPISHDELKDVMTSKVGIDWIQRQYYISESGDGTENDEEYWGAVPSSSFETADVQIGVLRREALACHGFYVTSAFILITSHHPIGYHIKDLEKPVREQEPNKQADSQNYAVTSILAVAPGCFLALSSAVAQAASASAAQAFSVSDPSLYSQSQSQHSRLGLSRPLSLLRGSIGVAQSLLRSGPGGVSSRCGRLCPTAECRRCR
eukprot:gene2398-8707_t